MQAPFLPFLSVLALSFAFHSQAQQITLIEAPTPVESASSLASAANGAPSEAFAVAPITAVREKPPRLKLLDWSGIGAAAALRVLDYTSTEKAMEYPQYFHEDILPKALVKNKPAFAAFQASTVAVNYGAYRLLVRHNLRPLAEVSQYLYVGVMSFQVASNYQLLGRIPAR